MNKLITICLILFCLFSTCLADPNKPNKPKLTKADIAIQPVEPVKPIEKVKIQLLGFKVVDKEQLIQFDIEKLDTLKNQLKIIEEKLSKEPPKITRIIQGSPADKMLGGRMPIPGMGIAGKNAKRSISTKPNPDYVYLERLYYSKKKEIRDTEKEIDNLNAQRASVGKKKYSKEYFPGMMPFTKDK